MFMTVHKGHSQCFALRRSYQKQCHCISLDFDETLRDDFFPLLLLDSGEVTKQFQKVILAVNENYYPPNATLLVPKTIYGTIQNDIQWSIEIFEKRIISNDNITGLILVCL